MRILVLFPWAGFEEREKKKKGSSQPRWLKNPPGRQEMWVQSLGEKDHLEKEMATYSQCSSLKNPTDRGAWQANPRGHKELDMTEHAHST